MTGTYIDIVEAETRLKEVTKEFEAFLDTRDEVQDCHTFFYRLRK